MEEQKIQNDNEGGENMEQMQPSEKKRSFGPMFGIILVIILLVLGGFYLWGQKLNQEKVMTAEEILQQEDPLLSDIESQSSSDEISNIEDDLDAINLDDLDAELENIDQEFNF